MGAWVCAMVAGKVRIPQEQPTRRAGVKRVATMAAECLFLQPCSWESTHNRGSTWSLRPDVMSDGLEATQKTGMR